MIRALLIASILIQVGLYGADKPEAPATPCHSALMACNNVIIAQDEAIKHLREDVSTLQERLANTSQPILPPWAILTIGVLSGIAISTLLSR